MINNVEVVYFPSDGGTNRYVAINKEIICKLDGFYLNEDVNLRDFFLFTAFFKRRFRNSIVVVNWLENFLKSKSGRLSSIGSLKYFLAIFLIKLHGAKLVYVRHNFYPHGMESSSAKLAMRITDLGQKLSDKKVSLSPHLEKSGYLYLPHPLYNNELSGEYLLNSDSYYVIFGRIERYKNIEKVIKEWTSDKKLVIAGSSEDSRYLSEIEVLSENKNIRIIPRALSDSEAEQLIKNSSGLIISHSNSNTIVSGSFFFGASCGAYILALETDFVNFLLKDNQYEGLIVVSSINELTNKIDKLERLQLRLTPSQLNHQARLNFGFSKVAASWSKILSF